MAIADYTVLSLADLEELKTLEDTDYILVNRGGNDYKVSIDLVKSNNMDELIGSIQHFLFTKIPSNYLLCDGSEYSKISYPKLYAKIGDTFGDTGLGYTAPTSSDNFRIPNLDGRFLGNVDNNAPLGTLQTDTMRKITGSFYALGGGAGAFKTGDENAHIGLSGSGGSYAFSFDSSNGIEGQEGTVSENVGSETRPKNARVVFAIRAS